MAFYGILESGGVGYRGNVSYKLFQIFFVALRELLVTTSSVEVGMMSSNS
jgi:hypothetical protein